MRILGIDPGTATTGYGIIEYHAGKPKAIDFGCIMTSSKESASSRLSTLYGSMMQLLDQSKPDAVAIEKIFFNTTEAFTSIGCRGIFFSVESGDLVLKEKLSE